MWHMGVSTGLTVGWGVDGAVPTTESLWAVSLMFHMNVQKVNSCGIPHGRLVLGASLSDDGLSSQYSVFKALVPASRPKQSTEKGVTHQQHPFPARQYSRPLGKPTLRVPQSCHSPYSTIRSVCCSCRCGLPRHAPVCGSPFPPEAPTGHCAMTMTSVSPSHNRAWRVLGSSDAQFTMSH